MDITSYLLGKRNGGSKGLTVLVVDELPQTGEPDILYLVPKSTSSTNNIFDEYLYTEDGWELIGSTDIDLSNYVDVTSSQNISGTKTFTTLPESSVVPSSNNQLANKKYVDDSVGTKQNEINSLNKLNADLVDDTNSTNKFFSGNSNDLIHYKGHVNSADILPSQGQDSEAPLSTIITLNYPDTLLGLREVEGDHVRFSGRFGVFKSDFELVKNSYGNYYLCTVGRFGGSTTSGSDANGYVAFITNYPEQLYFSTYNDSNQYKAMVIHAKYDANKPVYCAVSKINEYQSDRYMCLTPTYTQISTDTYAVGSYAPNYNGGSSFSSFDGTGSDWVRLYLNCPVKYKNYQNNPYSISTVKDGESFTYSGNTIIFTGDEDNKPVLVMSASDVTPNDAYTVGDNYDIYYGNSSKKWEVWSKQLDLTNISGYDSTTTQTLKNVNGIMQWVDE